MYKSMQGFLRLEGAVLLTVSVLLYALYGGGWLLFFGLLLLPDIAMLGYLGGTRLGAATYNLFHAYPLPALLLGVALLTPNPLLLSLSLIWFAHIGMDRLLGYGLKYPDAFKHTHLSGAPCPEQA